MMNPQPIEFQQNSEKVHHDKSSFSSHPEKSFSKILDDKVKSEDKESAEEAKKNPKEQPSEGKAVTRQKPNELQRELSPLQRFLYDLSYRDPSTWSISDRQHYRMDKTSENLQSLGKLLEERGRRFEDLSTAQLRTAGSLSSSREISRYLDSIFQETMKSQEQSALTQTTPFAHFRTSLQEIEKREGVKESHVLEQIIQQISVRRLDKGTEVTLVLKPEALGEVRLQLVVQGKEVTARFQTTNRRVGEILKEHLIDLNLALSKQGLDVKALEVEKIK